ncbi:ATP-dependent zinc protease family protein [Catalinimonas niigatensis]|uniref:ATP-dependent zinc protease family protein n=1 Tax=Catalinimonas niigatensis TaxID=1397264 RepID=UPI002665F66D|nr:RimK/LysX family protein [Catalinimonas niigatensis]WPP50581.1 RimK/LysX family protein [Catalinimonas niigatensis]
MRKKGKKVIGTRDRIDLPEFNLYELPCKIDTGAESSAIHCHRVRLIEVDGKEIISFRLLDPSHEAYNNHEYRTTKFKEKKIKNSFGNTEYRFSIKCQVMLFGETFSSDFTLADRVSMRYPVLLGKRLLKNRFMVDVSKTDLSYQLKLENNI